MTDETNCCADGTAKVLAAKLLALSHPARVDILLQLAGDGPCCCKQVVERFDLAQSTVSQHLKVLVDAGLVRLSPKAQRSVYEIDRHALAGVSAAFSRLTARCCPAENEESVPHG